MQVPSPRGELSAAVFPALRRSPAPFGALPRPAATSEDDRQVTLYTLQELSYRRLRDVDPAWEEDPGFLTLRAALERHQEDAMRARVTIPRVEPSDASAAVAALVADADGPSLSTWVQDNASLDHLRELALHRAAYQLKEADPHSFALPRLAAGRAKAALLEIQVDEYGRTQPTEAHSSLFRTTMRELDLDPDAEDLVDALPAVTLATSTLLSSFGRSRRLVGACLGHLAVFETTSVEPMARYAAAHRRVLQGPAATRAARFYDVHVAADGVHERLALDELVAGFAEDHPDEVDQILFGAAALLAAETDFSEHVLGRWSHGETSLRIPRPEATLRRPSAPLAA